MVFNEKHHYTLKALSCVLKTLKKLIFEVLLKFISKCNQNITKHASICTFKSVWMKKMLNIFIELKCNVQHVSGPTV